MPFHLEIVSLGLAKCFKIQLIFLFQIFVLFFLQCIITWSETLWNQWACAQKVNQAGIDYYDKVKADVFLVVASMLNSNAIFVVLSEVLAIKVLKDHQQTNPAMAYHANITVILKLWLVERTVGSFPNENEKLNY